MLSEAKLEIDKAIMARQQEGWKITQDLLDLQACNWYLNATATHSNHDFYCKNTALAEILLFHNLSWNNAIVGEKFTIPDKPNKPKRKIYISLSRQSNPIEFSVPENKFNFNSIGYGKGLKIKGEYDQSNRFQVYLIESRETTVEWDIFEDHYAVVDHINHDKKSIHYIVDRKINGTIKFSQLPQKVNVGDVLAIKVSEYQSKMGIRYSILKCGLTDKQASPNTFKTFSANVRVVSNGFAFTNDDIFIDKALVNQHYINDGDTVIGSAVLNYNKKKAEWGWKAILIERVA